jgi:hypothetical protein
VKFGCTKSKAETKDFNARLAAVLCTEIEGLWQYDRALGAAQMSGM